MKLGKIEVSGVNARTVYRKTIPKGIVGATVEIEYTDPKWDSLTKTVVFWGCCVKDVLNPGTVVEIPSEVVDSAGYRLRVGVYGVDAGNNLVIPTLWADLGYIEYSANPSGDESTDPSLPVWAQLQEQIDELKENGTGGGSMYELPAATADTLGGVKAVSASAEMTEEVGIDKEGKLKVKPGSNSSNGAALLIDLKKYKISNDGTNAESTTDGINQALTDAIDSGYTTVVFPHGEYLIAANSQVEVAGNLTVDFNHSTLRKEANASESYKMVVVSGRHNTVKNATLYGDREAHDYSSGGTHEWGNGIVVAPEASCVTVENIDIFDLTGYGINVTGAYNQIAPVRKPMAAGCYDINTGELAESTEYTVLDYTLDVTNDRILNNMFILGGNGWGGHGIDEPEGFYMTYYDENEAYLGYSHHYCFYDAVDVASLLYQHPTLRYIKFSIVNTDTMTEATIELRSSYTCEDVTIRNCEIARCRTLGIAVTGGKRVDIENVKIHDIGGALPGYAVDIEDGYQLNQYINFRNCAFYNNRYGAIAVVKAREITVDSCDFQGSVVPTGTIWGGAISASPAKSLNWYNCVVKNSTVKEMRFSGMIRWQNCHFFKCVNGDGSFEDCRFYNTGFQQQYGITLYRCEVDGGAIRLNHGNFLAVDSVFKGDIYLSSGTSGSGNAIESYVIRGCDIKALANVVAFPYAPYIEISGSKIEVDSAQNRPIAITPKVQTKIVIRDNVLTQEGRCNIVEITDTLASHIFIENNKIFSTAESGVSPYKSRVLVTSNGNVHIENNVLYITYILSVYAGIHVDGGAIASVRNNQIHGTCPTAIKVENATKVICDNNYCEGTVAVPDSAIGVNTMNAVGKNYVDDLIGDVDTVIANINSVVGGA